MHQLVREQSLPSVGCRCVLSGAKHQMMADGVGVRTYGTRALGRTRISVHANAAEVVAETLLHQSACRALERLAGRLQNLVYDRRRAGNVVLVRASSLELLV